jgi:hypothetical protein
VGVVVVDVVVGVVGVLVLVLVEDGVILASLLESFAFNFCTWKSIQLDVWVSI